MPPYSQIERQALADLFTAVGPDAPTVNEGWTTRDLAAHLVVRERRPDAAAGIVLRPLRAHGERVRRSMAAQPYPRLVELFRRPPWWSPVSNRFIDPKANAMEFFIHHEDVRRARPGWRPRELPHGQEAVLWHQGAQMARLRLRRFPATLLVTAPGYGEMRVGRGDEQAHLSGTPGELVLFLSGRQRVALVEIDAPASLADRLRTAEFGF